MELNGLIRNLYKNPSHYALRCTANQRPRAFPVYMEIPTGDPHFEIPVFALHYMGVNQRAIAAKLAPGPAESRYKGIEAAMKELLFSERTYGFELGQISFDDGKVYYATHGIVFNSDMSPVMSCSWEIERERGLFKFIRPIMRLSPDCYVHKSDPVERFLSNKWLNTILATKIYRPYNRDLYCGKDQHNIKVEFDEFPFKIKRTVNPSVSISNQQLLDIINRHIDEVA